MRQNRRTFLRSTALTGGAIAVQGLAGRGAIAAAAEPFPQDQRSEDGDGAVRQMFQSPPGKYRPLVRWWWPGDDVNDAELRRELAALDKAGLGGAEIQAFVKGFSTQNLPVTQRQRVNSYATPAFFQHVAVAAEEARSRGMFIDYTFGSGWPFGGGDAICFYALIRPT